MIERILRPVVIGMRTDFKQEMRRWLVRVEAPTAMLAALGLDVLIWAAARRLQLPVLVMMPMHGMIALTAAIWLKSRWQRRLATPLDVFYVMALVFLGPLGGVCGLLCALFMFGYRKRAGEGVERCAELILEPRPSLASRLHERIKAGRDRSKGSPLVRPLADVLVRGAKEDKQAVVALLAHNYEPSLAGVLHLAQVDHDPLLRIQVASATASIEKRYAEDWDRLHAAAEADPDNWQAQAALGTYLDAYAYAGFLEVERRQDMQKRACQAYSNCLQINPQARDIRHALGRLLLRSGEPAQAAQILAPLVPTATKSCDEIACRALGYQAECFYLLGRYAELRATAEMLSRIEVDRMALPEPISAIVKLWSGDVTATSSRTGAA